MTRLTLSARSLALWLCFVNTPLGCADVQGRYVCPPEGGGVCENLNFQILDGFSWLGRLHGFNQMHQLNGLELFDVFTVNFRWLI